MTPFTERNRKNAESSTGPSTPEGLARSSQNALKTGLYSASALLPMEDPEEYFAHAAAYVADLKPQGPAQADLVKMISDDVWCLRRIRRLVAAQTLKVCAEVLDDVVYHSPDIRTLQAQAAAKLEAFSRHEHRLRNSFAKSLKLLKQMQKDAIQEAAAAAPKTESGFVPHIQFAAAAATVNAPQSPLDSTPKETITPPAEEQKVAA